MGTFVFLIQAKPNLGALELWLVGTKGGWQSGMRTKAERLTGHQTVNRSCGCGSWRRGWKRHECAPRDTDALGVSGLSSGPGRGAGPSACADTGWKPWCCWARARGPDTTHQEMIRCRMDDGVVPASITPEQCPKSFSIKVPKSPHSPVAHTGEDPRRRAEDSVRGCGAVTVLGGLPTKPCLLELPRPAVPTWWTLRRRMVPADTFLSALWAQTRSLHPWSPRSGSTPKLPLSGDRFLYRGGLWSWHSRALHSHPCGPSPAPSEVEEEIVAKKREIPQDPSHGLHQDDRPWAQIPGGRPSGSQSLNQCPTRNHDVGAPCIMSAEMQPSPPTLRVSLGAVLAKSEIHTYRNETGPSVTAYTETNPKWIEDFNVRPKTVQLLQDNIGGKLLDAGLGNDVPGFDTNSRSDKKKGHIGLYQTKKLLQSNGTSHRSERQPTEPEEETVHGPSDKGLISKIRTVLPTTQ